MYTCIRPPFWVQKEIAYFIHCHVKDIGWSMHRKKMHPPFLTSSTPSPPHLHLNPPPRPAKTKLLTVVKLVQTDWIYILIDSNNNHTALSIPHSMYSKSACCSFLVPIPPWLSICLSSPTSMPLLVQFLFILVSLSSLGDPSRLPCDGGFIWHCGLTHSCIHAFIEIQKLVAGLEMI